MTSAITSRATVFTLLVVGSLLCSTVSPVLVAGAQSTLSAEVTTYNGQVATEDGAVTVSGDAATAEVVVVFIDGRGGIVVRALPVNGDRFGGRIGLDGRVSEGLVDGYVLSPGSDGAFGTPGDDPDSADDLVAYVEDLESRDLTQGQVRDVLFGVTTEDSASDDRVAEVSFVLTPGDVRIRDVVAAETGRQSGVQPIPVGERMVVRGTTNRRPGSVIVDVEVVDGPEADRFTIETVEEWETDGVWEVSFPVPSDLERGTYTVRATDGDRTATVDVEIVEATTPDPTTTAEPTTAEPTATTTQPTPTPEPTAQPTQTPQTTQTNSPGFGLLAPLAALLVLSAVAVAARLGRR